jgi:hypothetical protein
MVPRNASPVRSRLPPPPLLPLLVPLVVVVPLVVGTLTVSPLPLEVLPLEELSLPLDAVVPAPESVELEVVGAATVLRHDADLTRAVICPRLHDENWLLKLIVGAIRYVCGVDEQTPATPSCTELKLWPSS